MNILKFGGSSIADADKIRHVASIIEGRKNNSELAIVISAFGGVTDTIKTLAEYAAVGKNIDATFDSLVAKHTECAEKLSINNEINIRRILDEYFTPQELENGGDVFSKPQQSDNIDTNQKGTSHITGWIEDRTPFSMPNISEDTDIEMIFRDKYNTELTPSEEVRFKISDPICVEKN